MERYLVVTYNVTELEPAEVEYLQGETAAQAEQSDGHPSIPIVSSILLDLPTKIEPPIEPQSIRADLETPPAPEIHDEAHR